MGINNISSEFKYFLHAIPYLVDQMNLNFNPEWLTECNLGLLEEMGTQKLTELDFLVLSNKNIIFR